MDQTYFEKLADAAILQQELRKIAAAAAAAPRQGFDYSKLAPYLLAPAAGAIGGGLYGYLKHKDSPVVDQHTRRAALIGALLGLGGAGVHEAYRSATGAKDANQAADAAGAADGAAARTPLHTSADLTSASLTSGLDHLTGASRWVTDAPKDTFWRAVGDTVGGGVGYGVANRFVNRPAPLITSKALARMAQIPGPGDYSLADSVRIRLPDGTVSDKPLAERLGLPMPQSGGKGKGKGGAPSGPPQPVIDPTPYAQKAFAQGAELAQRGLPAVPGMGAPSLSKKPSPEKILYAGADRLEYNQANTAASPGRVRVDVADLRRRIAPLVKDVRKGESWLRPNTNPRGIRGGVGAAFGSILTDLAYRKLYNPNPEGTPSPINTVPGTTE